MDTPDPVTAFKPTEEHFRSYVENMTDILTVLDVNGVIRYISPSVKIISGYTPAELIGVNVLETIHPDDKENALGRMRQIFTHSGDSDSIDFRVKNKDGSYRTERVSGKVVEISEGVLQGIFVSHDVTDQMKDQSELRKFTRVIEQAPATIVITDLEGNIEYVNPAFEKITGYTKEEAIGQNPRILKSGSTPPESYAQLWKTILAGGTWKGEFANKKKNGQIYWENVVISPIFNDHQQITNFLAVKDDVTKHKAIEAEKTENDAILRRLITNLPGFVYRCFNDKKWNVTYLSEGVKDIVGYTAAEFTAHTIEYGDCIFKDDRVMVWESIQHAIHNHTSFELIYRIIHKDGTERWVWERGRGIYDTQGALLYLEGFITDISERKRSEEALKARTRELEAMNHLMVGRELKMRELKTEIEKLKSEKENH